MLTRRSAVFPIFVAAVLAAGAGAAGAQPFPSKPIRIMVGASPGGGTDIIARALGERLTESTKQPTLVENRPGASNTIAADVTAKATPDGHTILMATNTGAAIAPHLLKLSYDAQKDLAPIALIMVVPNVLVVPAAFPARDVKELIAAIRANPDKFQFGSSGVGSTQHIAGEAFKAVTGVAMLHVPYKGSAQALTDLISGQIQMIFDTTSSAMAHIKGGRIRPLALTAEKRSDQIPDTPTLAESGVSGADMTTWYGVFAPSATPREIQARLFEEIARALQTPELKARIAGLGGTPAAMTQPAFTAFVATEYARFGKLIREANIRLEN